MHAHLPLAATAAGRAPCCCRAGLRCPRVEAGLEGGVQSFIGQVVLPAVKSRVEGKARARDGSPPVSLPTCLRAGTASKLLRAAMLPQCIPCQDIQGLLARQQWWPTRTPCTPPRPPLNPTPCLGLSPPVLQVPLGVGLHHPLHLHPSKLDQGQDRIRLRPSTHKHPTHRTCVPL